MPVAPEYSSYFRSCAIINSLLTRDAHPSRLPATGSKISVKRQRALQLTEILSHYHAPVIINPLSRVASESEIDMC